MTTDLDQALQNNEVDVSVMVVGVDTSAGARRVVALAARVARSFPAAAIHVVHVFRSSHFDRAHAGAPAVTSDALHDAKDYLQFHVQSARNQCRNQVAGHFLMGDPSGEMLRMCEELKADLLVVGTHDYHGFERLLLGSIAETLMRKAPCAVLVARKPKVK